MRTHGWLREWGGSRVHSAHQHVAGLLKPLMRRLLRRGRSQLILQNLLLQLPGGPNEVGSTTLRAELGGRGTGHVAALSLPLGKYLVAQSPVEAQQPSSGTDKVNL